MRRSVIVLLMFLLSVISLYGMSLEKAYQYYYLGLEIFYTDYQSSLKYFKIALENGVSKQYVYYQIGDVYFNQKDYQQAINYFILSEQSPRENLEYSRNRELRYNGFHNEDNLPKVKKGVDPSNKSFYPSGPKLITDIAHVNLFFLAKSYYLLKNYDNAEIYFIKYSEVDNDNSSILLTLAECAYYKKNYPLALERIQQAMTIDPNLERFKKISEKSELINLNSIISKCYSEQGQYDKALYPLEENLKLNPTSPHVYLELAILYADRNNNEKAVLVLSQGLEQVPNNVQLLKYLSYVYQKQKNYQLALDTNKKVLEITPEDTSALAMIAYDYLLLGKYLQSIEYYTKALQYKKDTGYYQNMGVSYSALKNRDKAIECFIKAGELDPTDANIFYNISTIYFNKRDKANAIIYINKAIQCAPQNDMYYCFKGQLQILNNQLEPAIKTYLQVLEINPNSTDAMCNLGELYNKTGKPNRGTMYYKKAAALGDKNAKYYLKSNRIN